MQSRFALVIVMCFLFWTSSIMAQTGVIVPADNLVVEHIPPIPVSLADEVSRYTEFRRAGLATGSSALNRGHEHHRSIRHFRVCEGRPRCFGGAQRVSGT
jgi:hypothetical protein